MHHHKGLGVAHHGNLGILFYKSLNGGGVVRLHVLHYQIIRQAGTQNLVDVLQPLFSLAGIDGVHNRDLVVKNHIRIVGHAVGHDVLTFKQVHIVIVAAYIKNSIGNFLEHTGLPP